MLDLVARYGREFEFIRDHKDLLGQHFYDKAGNHIEFSIIEKKSGTCFDKPIVDWRYVRPGHLLWAEWKGEGFAAEWYAIRVSMKYGGVVFFRWMEGPEAGKMDHFELGSLMSDKMVYPYIIKKPKDVVLVNCHNRKQQYEDV